MGKKTLMLILLVIVSLVNINTTYAATGTTHTVTYIDWNGNEIYTDEVIDGGSAYLYEHVRIGYVFAGWDGSLVNVTEDRTVRALYVPKKYDISFKNLDGSDIINVVLENDYTIEALNEQVRTAYNLGWTLENTYDYYQIELELNQRVFIDNNIIWHLVRTNYGFQIDEYIVEQDGYEFIDWGEEPFLIKGPTSFLAQYSEIVDDNVIVDPEDPEAEILEFTMQDLIIQSNELLEVNVDKTMLISFIDSLVNTLEETVLEFPTLEANNEDGVIVTIPKDVLVAAEEEGIELLFNIEGYELLITEEGLSNILNNVITNLSIEVKRTSDIVKSTYDLGDFIGTPVETIEINLYGSSVELTSYAVRVTTNSNHEIVIKDADTYTLINSVLSGSEHTFPLTGNPVIITTNSNNEIVIKDADTNVIINPVLGANKRTFTLTSNSVIVKSILTEKEPEVPITNPVPVEKRFDPIEWVLDLDINILIVYGLGSYVLVYVTVYAIEFYRGKN